MPKVLVNSVDWNFIFFLVNCTLLFQKRLIEHYKYKGTLALLTSRARSNLKFK